MMNTVIVIDWWARIAIVSFIDVEGKFYKLDLGKAKTFRGARTLIRRKMSSKYGIVLPRMKLMNATNSVYILRANRVESEVYRVVVSDVPVVIIVDQYAQVVSVHRGNECFCFSLPDAYGVNLAKAVERRFLSVMGSSLDMDTAPYYTVGDLRYYRGVVLSDR